MTQTPLSPGLVSRIASAARFIISGVKPDAWFGPLQPLSPMAPPEVAGRRFDYPTGYNLDYTPRSYDPVSFAELRALADNCDIVRAVIETRKDQIEAQEWTIRAAVSDTSSRIPMATDDQKRRIDIIQAFLHCPDKEHGFDQWLRQILEDMFVIDGVALYKRRNRAGGLYALEVIDAGTIKLLLDDSGRLPQPPDPAYQQILKGIPAADYTREELMYLVHNPRSHRVYGYGHIEQILVTVNILIRRSLHQLEYYREGSIPDALISVPTGWSSDQISDFQKHFDAMLSGNLSERRRIRFMPGTFQYQETKAPPLKDAYDEFLARIVCFVFSISPEPFVGQVNRATAETSHARAIDEGLAPLMRFVRSFMNRILAEEFASPDLEFVWQDAREQDPAQAAQIDVAYVGAGIMTVDEVRANMGLPPIEKVQKPAALPAQKYNPNHLGAGPGGGQFTTNDRNGTSNGLPPGSGDPRRSSITPPRTETARTQAAGSQNAQAPTPDEGQVDSDPIGGLLIPAALAYGAIAAGTETVSATASRLLSLGAEEGTAATGEMAAEQTTTEDLLMPGGQRVGQTGSSGTIREVQGNAQDAQAFFEKLTEGGNVISDPTYNGVRMSLPNGGTASLRTMSTASPGTAATIDINIPNIPIDKIKFNP